MALPSFQLVSSKNQNLMHSVPISSTFQHKSRIWLVSQPPTNATITVIFHKAYCHSPLTGFHFCPCPHSVVSDSATPWTAAQPSRSLLKLMSVESVMPSNHLVLCAPFSSLFQSFPASGSFPMSQFFASGGQSIGVSASASVLPMNIQDWFPSGLTGWISLQPKGLSRVFSNTTLSLWNLECTPWIHSCLPTWKFSKPYNSGI